MRCIRNSDTGEQNEKEFKELLWDGFSSAAAPASKTVMAICSLNSALRVLHNAGCTGELFTSFPHTCIFRWWYKCGTVLFRCVLVPLNGAQVETCMSSVMSRSISIAPGTIPSCRLRPLPIIWWIFIGLVLAFRSCCEAMWELQLSAVLSLTCFSGIHDLSCHPS